MNRNTLDRRVAIGLRHGAGAPAMARVIGVDEATIVAAIVRVKGREHNARLTRAQVFAAPLVAHEELVAKMRGGV